jgi:hypothetical protein
LPLDKANCAAHLLNNSVKQSFGDKKGAISEVLGMNYERHNIILIKNNVKGIVEKLLRM